MKFFVNFFISILIMSSIKIYVEAETIDCEYKEKIWTGLNKLIYYCDVKKLKIFSNGLKVKIDGASGQHLSDYSNNNQVKGIDIIGASNMKFFPSNIENVFSNLIVIRIAASKLIHITNEDLKPFTKLKYLFLQYNLIEIIPKNLFIHNQELEVISLYYNKIQHIEKNAFSHLKKLRVLDLSGNTCNSFGYAQTRNAVLDSVEKIEEGICQSDKYTTTTTTTTENPLKQEIEELRNQLNTKEKEIQKLSESNKQKEAKIGNLQQEIKNQKIEMENQKKDSENLKEECQKCTTINKNLNQILNKLDQKEENILNKLDQLIASSSSSFLNIDKKFDCVQELSEKEEELKILEFTINQ
ncbi:hypothetical protein PVAND_009543 [Polypedilum vanderplanki]|uniref:Leucine rich repeat protein n=1 Tax=Polypedilum vanderplanki TaxID=319348 RepID=A0A9J6CD86_POLVA|nr:hypothetical protein PVAND_009543 [Polypedilum vanderplanki]